MVKEKSVISSDVVSLRMVYPSIDPVTSFNIMNRKPKTFEKFSYSSTFRNSFKVFTQCL